MTISPPPAHHSQLSLFSEKLPPIRASERPRPHRFSATPYLVGIVRFVMFHGVATIGQVHREFFAATGRPRQYCEHLLRLYAENGLLQKRRVRSEGRGRPSAAYQITAKGARTVGAKATERKLQNMLPDRLMARLQLTETIQVRADEGWKPVRGDRAFYHIKRCALKVQAGRAVDRSRLTQLSATPDNTPMRHNVLIRSGKNGAPDEARIVLVVNDGGRLRSYLKHLPNFYGFPSVTFEVVATEPAQVERVRKALDQLAKRRKFRFTLESVASFKDRPRIDTFSEAERIAMARRPMGWEPWLRVQTPVADESEAGA